MSEQIVEPLVSPRLAKLAKEKGFDQDTWYCWTKAKQDLENPHVGYELMRDFVEVNYNQKDNSSYELLAAPTHELLRLWLKERYKIHVSVSVNFVVEDEDYVPFQVEIIKDFDDKDKLSWIPADCVVEKFKDDKEAMDAGLFDALKLIEDA